jgi:hypothetical protein
MSKIKLLQKLIVELVYAARHSLTHHRVELINIDN